MRISRRSFILAAAGLAASANALTIDAKNAGALSELSTDTAEVQYPSMTLRGYGTLSAVHRSLGTSSITRIECESAQKALLVQAKYLSDSVRLPGVSSSEIDVDGLRLRAIVPAIGGSIVCYASGSRVLILAATTAAEVAALIKGMLPATFNAAQFDARTAVPMYLDRWDKHGLLLYFVPFADHGDQPGGNIGYNYNNDLPFCHDGADLGVVIWTNALMDDTAEGFVANQEYGCMHDEAARLGIPVHVNTSHAEPLMWLGNRYRDQAMLKVPQFLGGFYGVAHDSAASGILSWHSQEGEDELLGTLQSVVRRYVNYPNTVGWLEPHAETSERPQAYYLEYGPYADHAYAEYLKNKFGSLAHLSKRWWGDAGHYSSWDQIKVPEPAEFAGYGENAIDLRGTWKVRYESDLTPAEAASSAHAGFDDSSWDDFTAPGNDRMLTIKRQPLIYRRTLTIPPAWLDGQQVYLYVWDFSDNPSPDGVKPEQKTDLFVNGQQITEQPRLSGVFHYSIFDVSAVVKPGANLLAMRIPNAIICYRAYLTHDKPVQYPMLGPLANARWLDNITFIIWSRAAKIRRGAEMIRQVDPNRQINFMAPDDYTNQVKQICADYGGHFHDTGGMAGFWTEDLVIHMNGKGLPSTAEPGNGPPDVRSLMLFWGRWLTEGLNGVHQFADLTQITLNPPVKAAFEANLPMYSSIGKYHAPFAEVACLFSLQNNWLMPAIWDVDPKLWQPGGYYSVFNMADTLRQIAPRVAIDEDQLIAGTAGQYRIIFDSNTMFMDDDLIDGIERYVQGGGVFVTWGQTGIHSPTVPNSWPMSRLTGYEHVGKINNSPITPTPGDLIPGLTKPDRIYNGETLKKADPTCVDLLLWPDGSVAAGLRPIGDGWVFTFGVGPYRDDTLALLPVLLSHFGVTNFVPATADKVHFRHFVSNSGLQDIWVMFNESDSPTTTDLVFRPGFHPTGLMDIITKEPVTVTSRPDGDIVSQISFAPAQTYMYVSQRNDVSAAPEEWLKLQRGWWQGTQAPPQKALPTPAQIQRFSLDLTEGWRYRQIDDASDLQAAALAQPGIDDSSWEPCEMRMWLMPDDQKTKRIIMRRHFTVPPEWTSGLILYCANIPGGSFNPHARTFLDGQPEYNGNFRNDAAYFEQFGGALKPGSKHLLAFDLETTGTALGVRSGARLYYLPDPPQRQDLAGLWTVYTDAMKKSGDVQLPGPFPQAAYLQRSVVIDQSHANYNIVVYVHSTDQAIRSILINGQRLDRQVPLESDHFLWINISPYVNFGVENTIELLCWGDPQTTNVAAVELRFYEKGFFP